MPLLNRKEGRQNRKQPVGRSVDDEIHHMKGLAGVENDDSCASRYYQGLLSSVSTTPASYEADTSGHDARGVSFAIRFEQPISAVSSGSRSTKFGSKWEPIKRNEPHLGILAQRNDETTTPVRAAACRPSPSKKALRLKKHKQLQVTASHNGTDFMYADCSCERPRTNMCSNSQN
jgi:hypothetical protein